MFVTAYAVARFLWIPLLACWSGAKGAPGSRAIWLPIGVALLATAWEAAIPASMNIRIDLIVVAPALMFADGLGAILLGRAAYGQRAVMPRKAAAMAAAAALCLAACGFFAFAWVASGKQADDQYREYIEGARNFFEVAFRDDATQRATYGNLEGTRWAGYYVSDPPHPAFAHLVVNSAGDYFLYTNDFHESRGHARPDAVDPALLTGVPMNGGLPSAQSSLEMRDLGEGRLQLRLRDLNVIEVAFVKRAPPRFPRAATANDRVRYLGVFSAVYDDGPKYLSVAQVWLWEDGTHRWGVWMRGPILREREQLVSAMAADVTCPDSSCTTLQLRPGKEGAETLKWESPDALAWVEQGVTLKRGEIVTGLPYAWAPLTTMGENHKWLRSLHPEILWKPPPQ